MNVDEAAAVVVVAVAGVEVPKLKPEEAVWLVPAVPPNLPPKPPELNAGAAETPAEPKVVVELVEAVELLAPNTNG